jgi:hypothetical protein
MQQHERGWMTKANETIADKIILRTRLVCQRSGRQPRRNDRRCLFVVLGLVVVHAAKSNIAEATSRRILREQRLGCTLQRAARPLMYFVSCQFVALYMFPVGAFVETLKSTIYLEIWRGSECS